MMKSANIIESAFPLVNLGIDTACKVRLRGLATCAVFKISMIAV